MTNQITVYNPILLDNLVGIKENVVYNAKELKQPVRVMVGTKFFELSTTKLKNNLVKENLIDSKHEPNKPIKICFYRYK